MSIELKVIEPLIKLFTKIQTASESAVHQLKYMKYDYLFNERDDDIYVATYLKSGTTWMQMILYQLTTNGDVNFKHIYDVSPWLRNLAEKELPIPNLPSPRIIKMHDSYNFISRYKKGKYIFVIRDGRDVALSLYHHQKNYVNQHLSFGEVYDEFFVKPGVMNWFEFNRLWLQNSKGLPILYVRYEDLKNNFLHELQRIAAFINVPLNQNDLPRIIERTGFAFMKAHEEKFGEQPPDQKHEIVYNQFIRQGETGAGQNALNPEQLNNFTTQFNLQLAPIPYMESYRAAL